MKKSLKKALCIIMALVMLAGTTAMSFTAYAKQYNGKCGTNANYSFNAATGALTISGTGAINNYKLTPETPTDLALAKVNSPWFDFKNEVKSVVIQKGITAIGSDAFFYMENLTSATLPDTLTYIGKEAFYACFSLKKVNIPAKVITIGNYAFAKCIMPDSISVPATVTYIGPGAFQETGIKNATIYNNKLSVDEFSNCFNLSKAVIKGAVTSIPKCAFSSSGLTEFYVPKTVKTIGASAFECCPNLVKISIPAGVTKIGNNAFATCGSLTAVGIPNTVTSLGAYCFVDCPKLKKLVLSRKLTKIPVGLTINCKALKSVYIPKKVKKIGNAAFGASGAEFAEGWKVKYNKKFIIYSPKNKTAIKYAKSHGLKYKYKK